MYHEINHTLAIRKKERKFINTLALNPYMHLTVIVSGVCGFFKEPLNANMHITCIKMQVMRIKEVTNH